MSVNDRDNPLFCDHANENPMACRCPKDCYCQTRTCKSRKPLLEKVGYTYEYPRPAVTVDGVLLVKNGHGFDAFDVVAIERKNEPFKGMWALPGGFVNENESPEQAVLREIEEETGIRVPHMHQLGAWGAPDRDPRGWTISIAFCAVIPYNWYSKARAGDDAASIKLLSRGARGYELAFDHDQMIHTAEEFYYSTMDYLHND